MLDICNILDICSIFNYLCYLDFKARAHNQLLYGDPTNVTPEIPDL